MKLQTGDKLFILIIAMLFIGGGIGYLFGINNTNDSLVVEYDFLKSKYIALINTTAIEREQTNKVWATKYDELAKTLFNLERDLSSTRSSLMHELNDLRASYQYLMSNLSGCYTTAYPK